MEFTLRISFLYAAEAIVALVLSLVFFHFHREIKRQFIKLWAYSWLAFSLGTVVLIGLTGALQLGNLQLRNLVSLVSMVLLLHQLLFLVTGSVGLVQHRPFSKKQFLRWSIILFMIALAVILPYSAAESASQERYLLRLGFRYLSITAGFLTAGYLIAMSARFTKGIGKIMIAISFTAYGIYHVYYLVVVITNVFATNPTFPFLFGIVELVIVSLTGLSMVIWLLEEDRSAHVKTNRELEDFYYRVSHDLRAPIASMQGLSNIARLELKEAESLRLMELMETNIAKLDQVIFAIVNVASNNRLELKIRPIDFNQLIEEVCHELSKDKEWSRVEFKYDRNKENGLKSDPYLLKGIMTNLIKNAIDFNHQEKAHIHVSFERAFRFIRISVKDNGIGIYPESLPKLFDLFYKEDPRTKGSGLGLYTARQMLFKLNGSITVQSVKGSGSLFTIELPAL